MNDHHNALPAGYRLGEYEIQTVLGSGGFGVTYKAHDHNLDKLVAIKEYLPPEFAVRDGRTTVKPKSSASKDDYAWGLDRFLDEARALARFDHPHINKVYRFFKENGTAYLVLEYVEGDMLSELLKSKGRFNEAGVRRMLDELLDGLDKVHRAGYIHRDIKPANIIFRRDGSAVLLDFGAARQAIGQRSQMITSILTPGYAPVEQYLNTADAMGAWSDLYSLGVVAYRCLVGGDESVVIDAPSRAHYAQRGESEKDMPSAADVGKGNYSDGLLKAIDWAMKVDERERPQSVGEMRAVLAGEGDVEVVAAAPVVKKAKKKVAKKVSAKRAVKVDQTKGAQVPAGWGVAILVAVLALSLLGAVVVSVWHHQLQQAREIAEAERVEDAARQRAAEAERKRKAAEAERQRKIVEAIEAEQVEFRRLVGRNASARQVDGDGATDLHIAAANDWAKLARWLIVNGANVHARLKSDEVKLASTLKNRLGLFGADWSRHGQHPLHYAAYKNSIDAVKLLLANGANVHARSGTSLTPLHYAAFGDAVDATKLLIANGENVHARTSNGDTPLHLAADANAVSTAKLLLVNGANVHAKNNGGYVPLHGATYNNSVQALRLLLANGANVNVKNNDGQTPLDWALYEGHRTMQFLLRQHGGRCNNNCN